eukprot:gene18054-21558_t
MDGYHLDNSILDEMGFRHRKGSPPTFDCSGFEHMLRRLKQAYRVEDVIIPVFDRDLDLARSGAGVVDRSHQVLIVEGNYLLLKDEPWNRLSALFNCTVYLQVDNHILKERLIQRWLTYGYDESGARNRALSNDIPNATIAPKYIDELLTKTTDLAHFKFIYTLYHEAIRKQLDKSQALWHALCANGQVDIFNFVMTDSSLSDKLDMPTAICCSCNYGNFHLARHLHSLLDPLASPQLVIDFWKYRAVIGAVKSGDIENVRFVIDNGYFSRGDSNAALDDAVSDGRIEIYEHIKPFAKSSDYSPSDSAIVDLYRNGHLAMIQHLKVILRRSAYLDIACEYDHIDIVRHHLNDSPIVDNFFIQQWYRVCAKYNRVSIMEYLYSQGYRPETSFPMEPTYDIHTLRFLKRIGKLEYNNSIDIILDGRSNLELLVFLWNEYQHKEWFKYRVLESCVHQSLLPEVQFIFEVEVRKVLRVYLSTIIRDAVALTEHANRRTISYGCSLFSQEIS